MKRNPMFEDRLEKLISSANMAGLIYTSDAPMAIKLLSAAYENLTKCQVILSLQSPSVESL